MHHRVISKIAILFLISISLACSRPYAKAPLTWHLLLEFDAMPPDGAAAAEQTVGIIQRRLDAFGLSNFKVVAQDTAPNVRILVNIPYVSDRERLKRLITTQGLLELMAVVGPPSPASVESYSTREDAIASLGEALPGNRRVLPYSQHQQPRQWVVVEAPAIVNSSDVRNAVVLPPNSGSSEYQISFSLGPQGAKKFGTWTGAHINDYLAVVLNGEVTSIPSIRSQINDQGEISGRFTKEVAEDMALILRSGALPAPLRVIEEGPDK